MMAAAPRQEDSVFKNYLTYQFVLAFHRSCAVLTLAQPLQSRLLLSAETMVREFSSSIRATDPKNELKFLCVSLICLRDCREILDEARIKNEDIEARYDVLHRRLEKLCLEASKVEGGQFRMFG